MRRKDSSGKFVASPDSRPEKITSRYTGEEKERLRAIAQSQGIGVSVLQREIILKYLEGDRDNV